jgi:hypothetical protein
MAFQVQTLKEPSAAMGGEILLRYRLSGNTHPGSAEMPSQAISRTRALSFSERASPKKKSSEVCFGLVFEG